MTSFRHPGGRRPRCGSDPTRAPLHVPGCCRPSPSACWSSPTSRSGPSSSRSTSASSPSWKRPTSSRPTGARLDQTIIDQDTVVSSGTDLGSLSRSPDVCCRSRRDKRPRSARCSFLGLHVTAARVTGSPRGGGPRGHAFPAAAREPDLPGPGARPAAGRPATAPAPHLRQPELPDQLQPAYPRRPPLPHRRWHDGRHRATTCAGLYQLHDAESRKSRMNIVDEKGGIIFGPPVGGGELTVGRPSRPPLQVARNVSLLKAEELAASRREAASPRDGARRPVGARRHRG